MAYTVLAPSKRVRPVLTLLCGGVVRRHGGARASPRRPRWSSSTPRRSSSTTCPSMDDAPLRRGRQANHLEFGEAIAILAAFGLLNLAYGTLARGYEPPLAARLGDRCSRCGRASTASSAVRRLDLLATDQQISFETARAHPSRQDGRALQRRGGRRRADGRRRRRVDRGALGVREESRARVPDHRRPAGRRGRPGGDRQGDPRRTPARRRSCRSAASTARASSPRSCARPPTARSRRSAGAPTACASCPRSSPREAL